MTSASLPNLKHGTSGKEYQDLSGSRTSTGFADVSQLADEEKEKLDRLIERLEEERRRMMATTKILTAAQTQQQIEPAPNHTEKTPREKERERLQTELKDIRDYNQELEKELEHLRACLHPGEPPRSSTPHLQHTTSHQTHPHAENTPVIPQHTDPYFTPGGTIPKGHFLSHIPHEQGYYPAHEDYLSSSSAQVSPDQTQHNVHQHHLDPRNYSPAHERYVAPPRGFAPLFASHPRFEKLKGGESPIGYSSKSPQMPMKVPRDSHRSLGASPVPLDGESPLEFPKRSYRSLGNSPRGAEYGNSMNVGLWGSRKVLPDHPQVGMSKQLYETPTKVTRQSSVGNGVPNSTHRARSSQSFDGSSPQAMYRSIDKNDSSRSSSLTDVSRSSSHKMKQKRRSSRDRSSETQRTVSPALVQAYQRHLEANQSTSEPSVHDNLHDMYRNAPGYDRSPPTLVPKPRERQKRNNKSHQSFVTTESKSFESDSLSEASSRKSDKRNRKSDRPHNHSQSRESSRRSCKERKPSHQMRSHSSVDEQLMMQQHPHVSKTPQPGTSPTFEYTRSGHMASHTPPRNRRHRSGSESSNVSGHRDPHFARSDTHGSFVPARAATSHDNLAFGGSMDSLDTLHGGAPNTGYGAYGTSGTTITENSLRSMDPYSDIHSSDPNLGSRLPPDLRARRGTSPIPKNKHSASLGNMAPQFPLTSQVQSSPRGGNDTSHSSIHGSKPKDSTTRRSGSFGSQKSGSRASKERPPTPKSKKRSSPALLKKRIQMSDGDSSDSRTTPEGDLQGRNFELSADEQSFASPEEEMKFLISKLQGLMPSIHDQHTEAKSSAEGLNLPKPMNEILLAAHETRQAIRLFTDYAIAVAAGEVV